MTTPEWAINLIKTANTNHSNNLKLSGNSPRLKTFPLEILELKWLENLEINGNELNEIPAEIAHLKNLRRLNLKANHLKTLPDDMQSLERLDVLYLNSNPLISLPGWLGYHNNWRGLGLGTLGLIKVPSWLEHQKDLRLLDLADNSISAIPAWFGGLSQIRMLFLTNNKISTLPDEISELQNLEALWLQYNKFQEVPRCLYKLPFLNTLKLNRNSIRDVPPEILNLPSLDELLLSDNPIQTPPLEVVAKGIAAMREYYRQTGEQGIDHIYEAKLLVVGEGGAGKTSLVRKLQDNNYILQEEEKSTEGIAIGQWNFPITGGNTFRTNLWDFGGQEIYHATHQYFLTRRSLYILVADSRKEDTDFDYWLNVIELLGGESPVLIVKNEKQNRTRAIDETHLRGRFASLKEILATDLATNRGLDQVQRTIQHYLLKLSHVGSALPKTWVQVRATLETDQRDYVTQDEYFAICQQSGFTYLKDKLQLSGYLHDLGVCLHFQDDPILKHIVILKPEWGTSAAYQVLDNKGVIENQGCFEKGDLLRIWNRPQYAGKVDELLQLMIKFRLCYEMPQAKGRYIAPQLLGVNRPNYNWDESSNLQIRFCYDFMPKGLLTQLIVALHQWIAQPNLVWRSGVILEHPKSYARAEIIEYYPDRLIHLRVSGIQRNEWLTVVLHEMEKIHASYQQLKYDTLIPCNCKSCSIAQTPHFYSLDTLFRFLRDGKPKQCDQSYDMVDVRSLIDDVLPTQSRNRRDGDGEENNDQSKTVRQYHINTESGLVIIGNVSVQDGDFVGHDQQKVTFPMVYEAIDRNKQLSEDQKSRIRENVEDIEEEMEVGGDSPKEGFLTRRFKNIAQMAPDILSVAIAASTNPLAGFSEVARLIAQKAGAKATQKD